MTYGLADAGPGPVPASILKDAVRSRIPTGAVIASVDDADLKFLERRNPSFDERFTDARAKTNIEGMRKGAVTQSGFGMRLASLERTSNSISVLSDTDPLRFTALRASPDARILKGRSDSFDQRFSGMNALATAVDTKEGVNYVSPPNPSWVVQLIGDSSEAVAVSRFRELQNKHKLLLGMYKPVVLNTAITPGSEPIWTRIRVELSSREAAESLCSKLEAAGARCVVQRSDAGTDDANHALRQPASEKRAAPASAQMSLSPYQASAQQPSPQQPSPQAQVRSQQQGSQQTVPAITIITPGATAAATAGVVTTGVITGVATTTGVPASPAVGAAVSPLIAAPSRALRR
jgi:hypothetical protein